MPPTRATLVVILLPLFSRVTFAALLDGCPAEFAQQNLNGQGWVAAPKDCVKSLQTGLNKVSDANLDVDGVIGPLTTQAIRNFQAANGLKVDGIVGPQTRGALNGAYSAIINKPAPSPPTPPASTSNKGSSNNQDDISSCRLYDGSSDGTFVDYVKDGLAKFGENSLCPLICSTFTGYDTGICENHVCVCKGRGGNVPIKNLASNFLADAKSAVEAAIGRVLSG